jgi:hypothetical protein
MTRHVVVLGVLAGLLGYLQPASADGKAALTDVRYAVQGESSRVTLLFRGEVRYRSLGSDSVIRLGFAHTSVAMPMKARRQVLHGGLVTAVAVTQLPGDSTVVAITCRTQTTYRCILPASGNALHIDVLPTDGHAAPPLRIATATQPSRAAKHGSAGAAAVPPKASAKLTELRPQPSSVVDIAALARAQTIEESAVKPSSVTVQQASPAGLTPRLALLFSALLALLLTGSSAMVGLAFRKVSASGGAAPHAGRTEVPRPDPLDCGPAATTDVLLLEEPGEDDESHFAHDTSLQLARTFRRGSEEITLARRLHDRATPQLSAARLEETLNRATTPTQRLHFARKLGVGRGEMDLAMKLRAIRPSQKTEEVGT